MNFAIQHTWISPDGFHAIDLTPLFADSFAQNIPFALARGMFGAIIGAEFFGSPTICNVSQCSIALPSASIL
jgi:hypothetical protein